MGDGGYGEERGLFYAGACVTAPTPLEAEVCFCRTKLAVRAATDDPSQAALSYFCCNMNWGGRDREGGGKMQLPFSFRTSSLPCMKAKKKRKKHRAALVLMTTPKTNFPLATSDTGVQDPITPNRARSSKPLDITCYSSLPSLRFNKTSSIHPLAPRPQSSNYITSSCPPVSRLFCISPDSNSLFSLCLKKELDKDDILIKIIWLNLTFYRHEKAIRCLRGKTSVLLSEDRWFHSP